MEVAEGLAGAGRRDDNGPPCRRCSGRSWQVVSLPKSRLRWLVEMAFAAPDVWIFQSESGGWPPKEHERWTCLNCGRRVNL
ncbi:MAG TPA: hypothetical protein VFT91_04440 [Dehalococcoidia bacterium]|nr:hypothetical protein [Dehalococcoidia bacterium]